MSSRRKRAPPLRMNEEMKQQLCWNMHEDRRNEVIILDGMDEDQPVPGPKYPKKEFYFDEKSALVESSLSNEMLEDLRWLQKKRVIGLYQRLRKDNSLKVGVYLLEAGLSKPEFFSEGGGRIKKVNQLIQKIMEKFYNFIIPDVLEEDEEESDRELERQNIEELYDYVRHTHQQEIQLLKENVQHSALIPVLRQYQSEAVNWMLQRENFRKAPTNENALHFLWREVITVDRVKIYYNPFSGCIIREYPFAAPQWPGGILADEMGLGKTVEVLALILTHTRQDVKQDVLMLPEGKLVNYFVPPQPTEGNKKKKAKKMEFKAKEKVQYPSLRVMILAAVKEMNARKGASIIAIFKYVSTTYRYDIQRNHRLLKKTLEKLIAEQVVEQVKGHGLAGSFKVGKNYKEQKTSDRTKKQVNRKKLLTDKETKESEDKESSSENAIKTLSLDITAEEHDYCATSKDNREPETGHKRCKKEENLHNKVADLKSTVLQDNILISSNATGPVTDVLKNTGDAQHTSSLFPFNTSDYRFECICGELGLIDYKARVQCLKCHLWQHAECVNYKEENLKVKPFYCPHCLVAMKPVSTGATLIISPSSICHQWVDEINRHVRSSSLRVLVRVIHVLEKNVTGGKLL
uniref:H15 domain-containing protein n=1 Tax=Sphenodon punctatus TaxID=8508 RepID=A0A8D0GD42_SPHPU